MRMLLLSIHDIPHTGGKSTHVLNLAAALEAEGHAVTVLSPAAAPLWLRRLAVSLPARLLRPLPGGVAIRWVYAARRALLAGLLRRRGAVDAVVSCQDPSSVLALDRAGLATPAVLTMHSYVGIEFLLDGTGLEADSPGYGRIVAGERRALALARQIVAVDSRIARHLETVAPERADAIHVVPNFLDPSRFTPPSPAERVRLRAAWGLPADQPVVLCPRRLVEKNGVRHALEATARLAAGALLLVAGDGDERAALEALAARLGLENRVRFLGDVDARGMGELYALADVVVIPSVTANGLQEATSLSALEAMSAGRPVVASAIGGLAELITAGETGLLVPEGDAAALAAAVDRLLAAPAERERLGAAARAYVVAHHGPAAAAARFLAVYERAIAP